MAYSRSLRRLFFCALLSVSLLTPIQQAKATDAQTAGLAKMIGGVLVMHGMYSFYKDYTKFTTGKGMIAKGNAMPLGTGAALVAEGTALTTEAKAKMPLDLLEIAGGAAAMMMNGQSESELKDSAFDNPALGYTPGGEAPPGFAGGSEIPDLCASMPGACKIDPETNRPQIALPPKEEMMAKLSSTFAGQAVNPDGLSLDEALSDLDKNYDAAADAVAAFNSASDSGAFDAGINGEGAELASTGQPDGDAGIGEGLNTGRGPASGSAGGGLEAFTLPTGETTDWVSLLNKKKADRGTLSRTKAVGMNLEDARSGRLLTLFERVTRTLRGTRDRDILLAKVEWTRKSVLKTQNKPQAKPKLAVSTEKN